MSGKSQYPYDPARTLARAYRTGLTALRDLLRERVINNLTDVFECTHTMWIEAQRKWEESKQQGEPDFSHITRIERHMRANFLKMIWETTARYGNTEYKRIQNERKGKIGPMNRLLNMAGAQMRNFAVTRFRFSLPDIVERNGKHRVYGYEGDRTFPRVQVTHATLPEMDFIDMIRSHVFELCRKAFIYNVPMREARRYVNLLIYRLSPFLEYLYTSGESGRWGFKRKRKARSEEELPDADKILRRIVREMRGLYAKGIAGTSTVTTKLSEEYEPQGVSLFLDESMRLRESEAEEEQEDWGYYLRDLCDREILRDQDARWLQVEAKNRARWYGIRLHRILSMGFPQPYKTSSVILEGDKFAEIGEDLLIVAELPLKTNLGEGRADIIIFRREILERPDRSETVVWRPIAVFDIKSKTAFDWWIKGKKLKSKRHGNITIPNIKLKRRRFTDDEWASVLARTPSRYEKRQSEVYAGALLNEYRELTGDKTGSLPITGTIVVDVSQDNGVLKQNLVQILTSVFTNNCENLSPNVGEKLLIGQDDRQNLSLVIHTVSHGQRMMLREHGEPVVQKDIEPRLIVDSNLILYCSVPSASRSGPSGAWIAKYCHGLEYLYSMCESSGIQQVTWIDVSGDLSTNRLARTRLRLDQHRPQVRRFFKDIQFIDASEQIQSFLFDGGKMPTLQSVLPELTAVHDDSIIVVSGWEMLEQMVPERGQSALREFKRYLIDDLSGTENLALWFERPRRGEETSSIYQKSKSLPFSKYSPFNGSISKIVWNLPVQPYATGQTTPRFDDLRIIAEQNHKEIQTRTVDIPVLKNWSSKFWNKRGIEQYRDSLGKHRGRQMLEKDYVLRTASLEQDLRIAALDLIEGITCTSLLQETPEDISILSIEKHPLQASMNLKILRTPILTFSPRITGTRHGLGYIPSSITTPVVSMPRRYRSHTRRNCSINRTYRPPDELGPVTYDFDLNQVYKTELERIYRVIKLADSFEMPSQWLSFCNDLVEVIKRCEDMCSTKLLSDFLANHSVSSEFWEHLSRSRRRIMQSNLSNESKNQLESILSEGSNLVLSTGNYLFLMLLIAKYTQPTISNESLTEIWPDLKSWQLLQLGFVRGDDASTKSSFDTGMVWVDILQRVGYLCDNPIPSTPRVRYGRILVIEGAEDGYDYWLLLQKESMSSDMVAGMWHNDNPIEPSNRFHWSVNRSDILAVSAKQAASPLELDDIAVTDSSGKSFLWILNGNCWNPMGSIELIQKRNDEPRWIRGIKVNPSSFGNKQDIPLQIPTSNELSELVKTNLEQIQHISDSSIAVECSIELDSANYILNLHSPGYCEKVHEQLIFERTQELVDFLRKPLTSSSPIEVGESNSKKYTWNPYTDIHYDELDLLKPFVERKKPFTRAGFTLPITAKDVLLDELIDVNLVINHDMNLCPIYNGLSDDHVACWVLESIEDAPDAISSIVSVGLTDAEIGVILNTNDIHFRDCRYRVQIQFPEGDERIVFRESKIFARYLCEKRVPPSSFLRIGEETLECTVFQEPDLIITTVKSDVTGDIIYSGPLVKLSKEMDAQEALEYVEGVFESIIDSRYSSEPEMNRIRFYDELIVKVNEIIDEYISI